MSNLPRFLLVAFVALLAWGPSAAARQSDPHGDHPAHGDTAAAVSATAGVSAADWPAEVIERFERIAVQDGGRVKPLYTLGNFTLLRFNGKRTVAVPASGSEENRRIGPATWLLDVLIHPTLAAEYRHFVVADDQVIEAMGLSFPDRKVRDRYSFRELQPGFGKLQELFEQYRGIEPKLRSGLQNQVVDLFSSVATFADLAGHFDFAGIQIPLGASARIAEVFPERQAVRFSEVLERMPELRELFMTLGVTPGAEEELREVDGFLSVVESLAHNSRSLALIPPTASVEDEPAWLTPWDLFNLTWEGEPLAPAHLAAVREMESLIAAAQSPGAAKDRITALAGTLSSLAEDRGEASKIDSEVAYYDAKLLSYAQYLFVLAFVLVALMWLLPNSRALYVGAGLAGGTALAALVAAITWRCILRDRPPVSTLYETILFITAVGCLLGLVIEWIGRRRIALSTAAFVGTLGMFLAFRYEWHEKQDTMPNLQAVLDTNFWLATHVVSITIGYAAGLFAALLGAVFLILKLVRFKRTDGAFFAGLTRMTYGVLAFGLLFAIVGTILGGIWANMSWGRFWGWDPKENGALLICLAQTAILHGRMSGFLRQYGLAMATVFQGTVVGFSWWHVNLLGVGLHSYGFASGIAKWLWIFYAVMWSVVALGGVAWLIERAEQRAKAEALQAAKLDSGSPSGAGDLRGLDNAELA